MAGLFANGSPSFAMEAAEDAAKRKAALNAIQPGAIPDEAVLQGADVAPKWQMMTPAAEANMSQGLADTLKTPSAADIAAKNAAMTNMTSAGAIAAPMVSNALDPRGVGLGPSLTGAATGASVGTMVAPGMGTAIGAAIGAGLGLLQSAGNRKNIAAESAAAGLKEQADGLKSVASKMQQNINFKFGTSGGSFSSRNKGFS